MPKSNPTIAIVGATGLVGQEMIAILNERSFPFKEIILLASQDSVGEIYSVRGDEVAVKELDEDSFDGVDIALFSTSAQISAQYVPHAVEAGAKVIDNSSHYRMDPAVPLVVPEVNPHLITKDTMIIANPNCSTIQLVPVLSEIHKLATLKRVVVSSYQSVSGAGKDALDELWEQTISVFNQKEMEVEVFPHQIAFNCIPQIDVVMDDGYTKEEYKIINESRKILGIADLRITATAVRVPVFHAHAESVSVETVKPITAADLVTVLQTKPWAEVYPNASDYPMQMGTPGTDEIHVGRIRSDESVDHGLQMWIVADNIRKGAALNAVQIAEYLLLQQ